MRIVSSSTIRPSLTVSCARVECTSIHYFVGSSPDLTIEPKSGKENPISVKGPVCRSSHITHVYSKEKEMDREKEEKDLGRRLKESI